MTSPFGAVINVCTGCGALVADTAAAKSAHLDFHDRTEQEVRLT